MSAILAPGKASELPDLSSRTDARDDGATHEYMVHLLERGSQSIPTRSSTTSQPSSAFAEALGTVASLCSPARLSRHTIQGSVSAARAAQWSES
mmetsp:Transcript_16406/g.49178  ORF Transcript_16406/g.49178 Transcript_16406/m.49178 type:complete len:94 (-) Transcript_16406:155-436(-)